MPYQLIFTEQWQTQSWKNGGGITHQIMRSDDAKGMRWRLSIAEVATDGPFSQFEQLDRIIMLLDGQGFSLYSDSELLHRLDHRLVPYAFAGETVIDCRLIQGPVRDFNLMSRRTDLSATAQTFSSAQTQQLRLAPETLIFVVKGAIQITGQHQLELASGQTLYLANESGTVQIQPLQQDCEWVWIQLQQRS